MGISNYDLSIIIPTYNVDKYITETIKSITMQKTNYLYEVIFIDDGSYDNTVNLIEEYIKKNDNYKLYTQCHQGAGVARNLGIRKARGKYIYFLDSDDLLANDILNNLLGKLFSHDLDIIYFSGSPFWDTGYQNTKFKPNYSRIDFSADSGASAFYKMWQSNTYSPSACLYICKKEILIKNNIFFPERIIHEDNYFTFFLILSCTKHLSTSANYYKRRIRQNSVMTGSERDFSFLSLVKVYQKSVDRILGNHSSKKFAENKYIDNLYKTIFYEYSLLDLDKKKEMKNILKEVEQDYQKIYGYPKSKLKHYYYRIRRIAKRVSVFKNKMLKIE